MLKNMIYEILIKMTIVYDLFHLNILLYFTIIKNIYYKFIFSIVSQNKLVGNPKTLL